MQPLTLREREYVAIALSNYGDVQTHVPSRIAELLDLVEKLGVRPDQLSKGLAKAMASRLHAGGTP